MASNEIEVLDPEATVEKLTEVESGHALNRRLFITALGVAGAAAGTKLVSGTIASAQQPTPNGFAQTDVLNFLLNIKYLQATFYSYITQGTDLPAALTVSSGIVNDIPGTSITNANPGVVSGTPTRVTFAGTNSAQTTDLLNEIYYDELNQLITLRNLLGPIVINRPTINLLGTGPLPASTAATYTLAAPRAIAIARMLEDLSATAFAGAAVYLTGANLTYAAQILAVEAFHAGALRLISIQSGAPNAIPYQPTEYTTSFNGSTTSGSAVVYAIPGSTLPVAGASVSGVGLPEGAVVTTVTSANPSATASVAATGIVTKNSNVITTVSSVAGLAVGQPITGTNIPVNTAIAAITSSPNTITISAAATASSQVLPTGIVTSGSKVITAVSSVTGVIVGQPITGTGILPNTTVTGSSSSASTITMSLAANATSQVTTTGITTSGSATLTSVSSVTGLVVGQSITGIGIPANTTIAAIGTNTITLSANATATITTAETLTILTPETITIPTTEAITVGTDSITISVSATATIVGPIVAIVADNMDVEPADPGTAALSAAGPALIPGNSPALYQGFFNTAGSATSSGSAPAGFAFTRNFSQVLSILYNKTAPGTNLGGFFPTGVAGNINLIV